jgi:hypothetical protein
MKAKKALNKIREIANLLYDGYGDDIHPAEQLSMVKDVLEKYDRDNEQKETN